MIKNNIKPIDVIIPAGDVFDLNESNADDFIFAVNELFDMGKIHARYFRGHEGHFIPDCLQPIRIFSQAKRNSLKGVILKCSDEGEFTCLYFDNLPKFAFISSDKLYFSQSHTSTGSPFRTRDESLLVRMMEKGLDPTYV